MERKKTGGGVTRGEVTVVGRACETVTRRMCRECVSRVGRRAGMAYAVAIIFFGMLWATATASFYSASRDWRLLALGVSVIGVIVVSGVFARKSVIRRAVEKHMREDCKQRVSAAPLEYFNYAEWRDLTLLWQCVPDVSHLQRVARGQGDSLGAQSGEIGTAGGAPLAGAGGARASCSKILTGRDLLTTYLCSKCGATYCGACAGDRGGMVAHLSCPRCR